MNRQVVVVPEARGPEVTVREIRTSYLEGGRGDPVVLLHGGCVGASAEHTWSDTIEGLSDRYRVIAPDLIWSGLSDKPRVPVSLPLQAAHVAGFIDALGLDRVRIVGQSVGAYLAARYACDHVGRVSHLVMMSTNTVALAMGLDFPHGPIDPQPVADELERQRELLQRLYHRHELVTDDLVQARAEINRLPGIAEARASWAAYSAALLQHAPNVYQAFELRTRLPVLELPALLIWGREDRFAPVSIGHDLSPLLPRIPYLEIEDAGHALFRDQAPTVNALLAGFFAGTLSLDDLPGRARRGEVPVRAGETAR